ncbi:MAG TPA: hypothetical protein DEQ47_13895 [Solibacterales bacterium]|nr:hypothetical protein [Bryobacterales bacterium]
MLAGFFLLLFFNALLFAGSADTRQIAWSDLPTVFHKNIRIVMPDGTRIEGKAVALETDALAVQVTKTTNGNDYPKGRLLVPRATLRAFDIPNPTYHWRVLGTVLGILAGVAAGVGIYVATDYNHDGAAWAGGAAIPVVGYFMGQRADQRVTTYVLTQ